MTRIPYWPFYCEENIWHLCANEEVLGTIPLPERQVIFISNARRQVAVRKQRAGGGGIIRWDYHVVLLAGGKIWDLDTTLGVPVDFAVWKRESFLPLEPGFAPLFRRIDAPTYRAEFASDRSHMLDARGIRRHPVPPWPPIGRGMTLPRFIDLKTPFVGDVLDLDSFR